MILRLLLLRLEGASLTILQARYVSGVVAESATTQTVIVWKLQNMAYAGTGELASQEGADLCGENKDEEDEGSGTAVDDETVNHAAKTLTCPRFGRRPRDSQTAGGSAEVMRLMVIFIKTRGNREETEGPPVR